MTEYILDFIKKNFDNYAFERMLGFRKEYDDDGYTTMYKSDEFAKTLIESDQVKDLVSITIHPTKGNFKGFIREKSTEVKINVSKEPKSIIAKINNKKINKSKRR